MNQQNNHRSDIDGLRALAVILVVLYHYFPEIMPAGFIGVSVFFVISGYLISTIILQKSHQKGFLKDFYVRRINRILPALILVLLSSLMFGWITLTSVEYATLSRHVLSSAMMLQNFNLASESGYFDESAYMKPLQHLWSISIEEQFYVVWPIILAIFSIRRTLFTVVVMLGFASFAISALFFDEGSASAYYNPVSRSWELIAGAIIAVLHNRDQIPKISKTIDLKLSSMRSDIFSGLSIVLLIISSFIITDQSSYPFPFALFPVVAAALFLWTGNDGKIKLLIFANRPAVWIGKISYPLYLWHWLVFSFIQINTGDTGSTTQLIGGLFLSILLAALTFIFLESRLKPIYSSERFAACCFSALCFVASFAYLINFNNGFSWRLPELERWASSIAKAENANECFGLPFAYRTDKNWYCKLGDKNAVPTAFVFGDSHALSLLPLFDQYAQSRRASILFTGFSECPPLLGVQSMRSKEQLKRQNCMLLNERVFAKVRDSGIKNVIFAARWTYYTISKSRPLEYYKLAPATPPDQVFEPVAGWTSDFALKTLKSSIATTVERYNEIGVRVIFIKDVPQQIYEPKKLFRSAGMSETEFNAFSVSQEEHYENQALVNRMLVAASPYTLDLDHHLCPTEICPIARDGQFLYFDDDHLSVFGAQSLFPIVAPLLDRDLSR